MGFFDFFTRKKHTAERSSEKSVARWESMISKKTINLDRQEAIHALARIASERKSSDEEASSESVEAARVLLRRFGFSVEPSISDEEEKDAAFRGIVGAGVAALSEVRESCKNAESITWQLRMMQEMLSAEDYVSEVLAMLEKWDTEYDRNPDPKIQLLGALEDVKDPRNREAVVRFLDDVHEPTRFHAVTTLLAQDDASSAPLLADHLEKEEAVRIRNRIAEGLVERGWAITGADLTTVKENLPRGYTVDASDKVVER